MKRFTLSALAVFLAAPALAHPGHGADPVTHWVADLPHIAVTVGLAVLTIVALGALLSHRRTKHRRKSE